MKIAIIGGGITGLAAAYYLQKASGCEITLYEASDRLGGKIATSKIGDYLVELAPDSVFSAKPWANELIAELGLESEVIEPKAHGFSILKEGKLYEVPRELAAFAPTEETLARADFFSQNSKRRILEEPGLPAIPTGDESIASFFTRRFGSEFSELVAEPLLAGTHAGDPMKLSMAALYPGYLEMERRWGSVGRAMAARPRAAKVGFSSLRSGMDTLCQALLKVLTSVRFEMSASVHSLELNGSKLQINGSEFDRAVLAIPAPNAAEMLEDVAPGAANSLRQVEFVSTAIVTLAYPLNAFETPPNGNGFLVPYTETSPITGCTWSSNKWDGRAPSDQLLARIFLGRAGEDGLEGVDEDLGKRAVEAIGGLLQPRQAPAVISIKRFVRAMPQYNLGHLERLGEIKQGLEGLPISVIGSSYRGSGIPDCIRQGREVAERG